MGKARKRDQIQDPLSAIPTYQKTPEGVFDDIDHYRRVATRIMKALSASRNKKSGASPGSSLYEGIRVEFSTEYTEEEISLDNLASKIVLRAPKRKGESESSLQARRMHYLEQLLRPVEAMKTTGIATIYLTLKQRGRRKISSRTNPSMDKRGR